MPSVEGAIRMRRSSDSEAQIRSVYTWLGINRFAMQLNDHLHGALVVLTVSAAVLR